MQLQQQQVDLMVRQALAEDLCGDLAGDIDASNDITALLIGEHTQAFARVISREDAVFCGREFVERTFALLDPQVEVQFLVADGEAVSPNQVLFTLQGNARSLLTGERTALNFVQTLSGIASTVALYAQQLQGTACELLDTRKTLPGLRAASKYAVVCGGGHNHRFGLFDVFLVKENHIAACGSIAAAVAQARLIATDKKIEVEVENLDELQQAIAAKVDVAMLDNFSFAQVQQAVALTAGRIGLEVSGNVSLQNIREYALSGVNYISVGALTRHVRAIDLSMRFVE